MAGANEETDGGAAAVAARMGGGAPTPPRFRASQGERTDAPYPSAGAASPRRGFHAAKLAGFSGQVQILPSSREASHELTWPLNRPLGDDRNDNAARRGERRFDLRRRGRACREAWAFPALPGSSSPYCQLSEQTGVGDIQ
jgi:hypothetical protein